MNNNLEHGSPSNLTDHYISSLNSANPRQVIMDRATHNPSDQDMHQQAEEYKKSVTIIFWYQANALPVRLHHMIPTFPFFQLSKMNSLVLELALSPTTYLETYNPDTGQWDQHSISAVRKVETQQRLLYRLRKSLLEGLKDEECLGIQEELKIQRRSNKSFRTRSSSPTPTRYTHRCVCKRSSDDDSDIASHISHKVHIPNDYYLGHHHQSLVHRNNGNDDGPLSNDPSAATAATTALSNASATSVTSTSLDAHTASSQSQSQSLLTPPSSSSSNVSSDDFAPYPASALYDTSHTSPTSNTSPSSTSAPSATSASAPTANLSPSPNLGIPISPYPPHPPLKRWPNDYTVAEISAGFANMDTLVAAQSTNGSTMTHKAAFERVFGSRYVKSTVCRHRGVWKKAHPTLKAQYEGMGHDDRAYWGEFVRVVEGRPSALRGASAATGMNVGVGATAGACVMARRQGGVDEDEDGGNVDDARVIKNLQGGQVGTTMTGIDSYDSPLATLTNASHS